MVGFGVRIYPALHFSLGYASQLISPFFFPPHAPIEVPQVLLVGFGVRIPVRRYPNCRISSSETLIAGLWGKNSSPSLSGLTITFILSPSLLLNIHESWGI